VVTAFFRGSPVVIGYNWQGYYVGANIGWSRASSDIAWTPDPTAFGFLVNGTVFSDVGGISSVSKNTLSSNGAAGGIQTGYNWQWGNVVAGIEGDVSFVRNNANVSLGLPPPSVLSQLSDSARLA